MAPGTEHRAAGPRSDRLPAVPPVLEVGERCLRNPTRRRTTMSTVAFLGLGIMGRGMVRNLLKAGHDVTVWNRSPEPVAALVDNGASASPTIAECVTGADFVLYCLADDAAVRAVVLGEGGLASVVSPSSTVIDLSTISPEASEAERAA